ncbi:MAG TPA: hypothetical protein VJ831_01410 [Jatrophihabitantaceae bacterium]|nr:hypothetical protein [Jatrophihabitantaceae bacterium]
MSKLKFAAGLLVVLTMAAACSGADKKPAPGTSGLQASPAPPTSSSSSSESATGPTLKVLATQPTTDLFTFDTAGTETVSGGAVSVTLTNGTTVAHELRIFRLRDSDFNSFKIAVGQNGAAVATTLADLAYASPTVAAGKTNTDTANLAPGSYALVCFLTAPDGKTYAQHGMFTRLEVTPAEALPTGSGSSATSTSSAAGGSGASASSGSTAPSSSSSSSGSSSSSSSSVTAN